MQSLDLLGLLHHYGLLVLFAGVALESMGLPVPGETILVLSAAGLAHTGGASFTTVLLVAILAAVVGDNAGYSLGRFGGWPLLRRYGRWVRIDQGSLKVARYLFARYGGALVFTGRFVAILRTSVAFLAGVNHLAWRRFLAYNAAGAVVWATAWTVAAYLLGAHLAALPGWAGWAVAAVALAGVLAGAVVIRRRIHSLRAAAERAYPGPL